MTEKFIEENYDTSQSPRNGSQNGDLTSQWHKGELPNDEYYVVNKYNVIEKVRYCKEFKGFCDNEKDLVKEVLAEVPDYIEWRNMVNCACEEHEANKRLIEENKRLKHDVGNLGYKIKNQRHEIDNRLKEIEKLKELLKQSRIYVKIETEDYDDRTVSKADKEKAKELLTKIKEELEKCGNIK